MNETTETRTETVDEDDALARAVESVDRAYSRPHPFDQSTQIAIAYALIAICKRLDKLIWAVRLK